MSEVPTAEPDLEGFKYSKRSRRKRVQPPSIAEAYKLRKAELLKSQFYVDFRSMVMALELPKVKNMQMLGIGTLTHNPSLSQLVLGLELASFLDVTEIETYDPMYTAADKELLKSLDVSVNEPTNYTLVFAPHVPKSLYERILQARYPDYSGLILLGNDLRHYPEM